MTVTCSLLLRRVCNRIAGCTWRDQISKAHKLAGNFPRGYLRGVTHGGRCVVTLTNLPFLPLLSSLCSGATTCLSPPLSHTVEDEKRLHLSGRPGPCSDKTSCPETGKGRVWLCVADLSLRRPLLSPGLQTVLSPFCAP